MIVTAHNILHALYKAIHHPTHTFTLTAHCHLSQVNLGSAIPMNVEFIMRGANAPDHVYMNLVCVYSVHESWPHLGCLDHISYRLPVRHQEPFYKQTKAWPTGASSGPFQDMLQPLTTPLIPTYRSTWFWWLPISTSVSVILLSLETVSTCPRSHGWLQRFAENPRHCLQIRWGGSCKRGQPVLCLQSKGAHMLRKIHGHVQVTNTHNAFEEQLWENSKVKGKPKNLSPKPLMASELVYELLPVNFPNAPWPPMA